VTSQQVNIANFIPAIITTEQALLAIRATPSLYQPKNYLLKINLIKIEHKMLFNF